jgi:hypothetical protein
LESRFTRSDAYQASDATRRTQLQPQLGSAAQPQLASQPQVGSQHECFAAQRARRRANKPGFSQHEVSQPHEASQPQLGSAQPHEGSAAQPQLGSQASAQPHDGSAAQPQLASQPQLGSQHECFAAQRAFRRANKPGFSQQLEAHGSQQDISQPQLGSAAQPQLGSAAQPQPPSMPKNAKAFPALDSAMATPSVDSR